MATYRKRDYSPLRGRKLEEYGRIMFQERLKLIVSPERRDWILANYPPSQERGRAIVLETKDESD